MKNILLLVCTILFITNCDVNTGSTEESSTTEAAANETGEPSGPHTSAEWQIWAYSTAAPSFIAKNATVLNGKMEMLREGTNGWTCLPVNPRGMSDPENGWKSPHEAMPLCGDGEVFKWISAYLSDQIPDMDRDGYAWMLHGDMGEDNSTPKVVNKEDAQEGQWIESGPHLMLMPKDPATLEGHTADFNSGSPYVMFPGTPYTHMMIPVENYYQYHK